MKIRWVISLIVVSLLAVTIASATAVLAGPDEGTSSGTSKLSSRVAAILGLDEKEVDDAIKQGRRELKDDNVQHKLNTLVDKGHLTREQANEKLHAYRENVVSKKKHGGLAGRLAKNAKGSFNGDVGRYLSELVEKGEISQEQANETLRAH